ncbi:hypothetical protein Tco_0117135 [Tanacetum coccineum]
MEMLHAQTDLIGAMQDFLKKYDHIPHNEKSIKLLLAEEKFLKIKQVVEEEQTQPEYLQELLQSLLKDLQILNEIQPLKQETPNQIQKDQEEKSIAELLAEERLQKANQALNESQSPQEMRIQDLEIQKQQCLEEIKEWMNDLGIREYQKEEIDIDYRRKCEDKIYELKDKFNGLSIEIRKIIQEAEELRESEARARIQKIIIDDDDDDLGFYAVHPNTIHTPVSQNVEPKDSLIMGDGHINTTPETETISVETLVSNPSESDDFSLGECNLFDIDDSYYEKSTSRLAHLAPISPEIVEACVDDDDTDDDDDYDDDFYINAFSLSPPIPISPIFCPSSTIPVVDLDLPLEEADVPSFSDNSILRGIESDCDSGEDTTSIDALPLDDSIILSEYESFTFDDEPVMAEVNVFDEINTSELSYPGIGFPDFGRFMVQIYGRTKQCPQFSIDDLQSSLHKPEYQTYSCESCGNDAHYGYPCPSFVPDPCYNRNFDCFPHDSQTLPQQYLCCENCGGPHETYQCQPMNQEYFNSHSSGFDQFQPPQFSDVYQTPPVASMEMLHAQTDLIESMQNFLKKYDHIPHNEKSIKLLLAEEKFLKIKQVVEEEQTQPEYLQELLQSLLKDLQILNDF